jgi:catechol 2,3-dioxygenase-like lactoylglutathione lyase family enzyme
MRLARALIVVPDMPRATAFYRDVLGLSLRQETADHLVFAGGGWTLMVFRCDKCIGDGGGGGYANEPRSVLVVDVAAIEHAISNLAAKGVTFLHPSLPQTRSAATPRRRPNWCTSRASREMGRKRHTWPRVSWRGWWVLEHRTPAAANPHRLSLPVSKQSRARRAGEGT